MPVDNSRVKGLYKMSVEERRALVAKAAGLTDEHIDALASHGELDETAADRMIENVIGTMSLPVGVATNFVIDGKHYFIPFCLEESSVVAAASNMAKRCLANGGFRTNNDAPVMIGQIQLLDIDDMEAAQHSIREAADELMAFCNDVPSRMIALGGGCKAIETRVVSTNLGTMLVVHLLVDCRDAMGANAVNTMAERVAPKLEALTEGRAHLRILSNLAAHRLARVEAVFTPEEMASNAESDDGEAVIQGILEAHTFAVEDPYRATTHNKGIMNAISSVALACGQDWRAIEAGCHAWTTMASGTYTSMSSWSQDKEGNLVGVWNCPWPLASLAGLRKFTPLRGQISLFLVLNPLKNWQASSCAQDWLKPRSPPCAINQGNSGRTYETPRQKHGSECRSRREEVDVLAARLQAFEGHRTQTLVESWLKELRDA